MKSKVTLDDLKKTKPDFPSFILRLALESINAAYEAVTDASTTKEEFLKVVASDYAAVDFIGKAILAAREDQKSELAVHAFYLFDDLLGKQTELA